MREGTGVRGSGPVPSTHQTRCVNRALDNNLNRLVALKLLRTEYSDDPDFVRQFEHEAQLTASINHPNVVRVFSFGTDESHVYLAMELVDHGTMDGLMEKRRPSLKRDVADWHRRGQRASGGA